MRVAKGLGYFGKEANREEIWGRGRICPSGPRELQYEIGVRLEIVPFH